MKAKAFSELLGRLPELTPQQRERLCRALTTPEASPGMPAVLETSPKACPHCAAESGIVEMDETFVRQSDKGHKALSRKPRRRGGGAKASRVDADSVLCTDALPVYQRYSRECDLTHEPVNLSQGERVRERVFHVQNVNAYDRRLKQWLDRFHGVATKYLDHYLGWFRMIDSLGERIDPSHFLTAAVGVNYQRELLT